MQPELGYNELESGQRRANHANRKVSFDLPGFKIYFICSLQHKALWHHKRKLPHTKLTFHDTSNKSAHCSLEVRQLHFVIEMHYNTLENEILIVGHAF